MGKPTYRQQELERVLTLIAKIPTGWSRCESVDSTSYLQHFGGYAIDIRRVGLLHFHMVYVAAHRVLRGRKARRIYRIRKAAEVEEEERRRRRNIDGFLEYAQRTFTGEGDAD